MKLVFVVTPLSVQHWGVRAKRDWFGSRIICPSGTKIWICDVMVSVLISSTAHSGLVRQSNDNKIGIFYFSAKHEELRSKRAKIGTAQNQDNMS